jgi:hypothetical protein
MMEYPCPLHIHNLSLLTEALSYLCCSLMLLACSVLSRTPCTRTSQSDARKLSEKGCELRSGRVFGPSIGTKTGRTGCFGALWASVSGASGTCFQGKLNELVC